MVRREQAQVQTPGQHEGDEHDRHEHDEYAPSAPQPSGEREVLTWELFGHASRDLAHAVANSGFRPDVIVAVARGGLIPAGALGYALDVKDLHVLNIEFYTGVGTTLAAPVLLPPVPDNEALGGKKALVVDDVADSGSTLALVKEICQRYADDVRCAVVYEKSRSIVKCEYVWRHTDSWINFPWSTLPPVQTRTVGSAVLDA